MLKTFHKGGIHPKEYKLTKKEPIQSLPISQIIALPLNEHIGAPARPIVKAGETVKKGQIVAEASAFVSAHVHASTSGTVKGVERMLHPSGHYTQGVVIQPDNNDEWLEGLNVYDENYTSLNKEEILSRIKAAAVVGMGGAGFPAHIKLNPPPDKKIDTIIMNGAECEPFLTSDHRIMLEYGDELVKGMKIIASLFDPSVKLYMGVEHNKHDAVEILKKCCEGTNIQVVELRTKYPQGDERKLISVIAKRELKPGQLPFDVGCIVHNAGTVFAIYEAVALRKPLIERVITVTGMSIHSARNFKALLGTKVQEIVDYCGGVEPNLTQVIVGGPMMGRSQYSLDVPIVKTTSGILFIHNNDLEKFKERACIRCGSCYSVCPQALPPSHLAELAIRRDFEAADRCGMKSCMECGSCSFVCPSKRELVNWIRFAKLKYSEQLKVQEQMKKEQEAEKV